MTSVYADCSGLVDIAHVLNGLPPDLVGDRRGFHIVEPLVGTPGRALADLTRVRMRFGPASYEANREQSLFIASMGSSSSSLSIMKRMYFAPAWNIRFDLADVADLELARGLRA